VIPLAVGLVGQAGQPLPMQLVAEDPVHGAAPLLSRRWGSGTRLLLIDQAEHCFRFEGLPPQSPPPALSLLRQFSAPVRVELGRPCSELVHLLAADSDPFARWDAGQLLLRRAVLRRAAGRVDHGLEDALIDAFERILADPSLSEASRSVLMALPGLAELEDAAPEPDPPALFAALQALRCRFGEALAAPLLRALERCSDQWTLPWPEGTGDRMLTATIWSWRAAAGDGAVIEAARQAVEGPSMTLARAGLRALQDHPIPARQQAVEAFHARWQEKPVILDSWFALEAGAPFADGLERVQRLLDHPRFDPAAPNSVRAVLGGLAGNAPVFHAADGSGYRFMADQIADLDRRNPITASRMAKVFSRWQSYGPGRRERMREALDRLAAAELSANTREVVDQCLGGPVMTP
jgi:aminopeptidase N